MGHFFDRLLSGGRHGAGGHHGGYGSEGRHQGGWGRSPAQDGPSPNVAQRVMACGKCGGDNPADAHFCAQCGEGLGARDRSCAQCGGRVLPGAKFCTACGKAAA
ncbi:zinc ribbon domain-containing protein [Labrys portucalensis]|uniref:Zinc ribbon domain-containing protein n=1 Tax=Labrys neptuniae TaxID=376174 RepID=A0ABV6ZI02_9HYPH